MDDQEMRTAIASILSKLAGDIEEIRETINSLYELVTDGMDDIGDIDDDRDFIIEEVSY